MDAPSILSWLVTIVHLLLALAFGVLCLVKMKRLGTGGALLLFGVALFDVLLTIVFRVFSLFSQGMSSQTLASVYSILDVVSALVSLLSGVMILIGFILVGRLKDANRLA